MATFVPRCGRRLSGTFLSILVGCVIIYMTSPLSVAFSSALTAQINGSEILQRVAAFLRLNHGASKRMFSLTEVCNFLVGATSGG